MTDAIVQTNGLIEKEMSYSPELRNEEYLNKLRTHVAKLEAALNGL